MSPDNDKYGLVMFFIFHLFIYSQIFIQDSLCLLTVSNEAPGSPAKHLQKSLRNFNWLAIFTAEGLMKDRSINISISIWLFLIKIDFEVLLQLSKNTFFL